jgi:uncharacterized membrane protein
VRALVAVIVAACDPAPVSIDQHPCPPGGTDLTYANFGAAFVAAYCETCHAASGDARDGAPDSFRFDTLDEIHQHAGRIFIRAAGPNATMPPGPNDPPRAERDMLADWLACGAP